MNCSLTKKTSFSNGSLHVDWQFHLGDFPAWLSQGGGAIPPAHAIFYDAFSPAKNPAMWTPPRFSRSVSRPRSPTPLHPHHLLPQHLVARHPVDRRFLCRRWLRCRLKKKKPPLLRTPATWSANPWTTTGSLAPGVPIVPNHCGKPSTPAPLSRLPPSPNCWLILNSKNEL